MQPDNTTTAPPLDLAVVIAAVERVIVARRGACPPIGADTRFDELGLNSLDFAEAFVTIEEAVGYGLDPESAGDAVVVGDLIGLRPL